MWTLEEKQRLIDSIFCKYPIPAIFLAATESDRYEIIDGLQRLHTVMAFIEGGFPTLDGRYFDVTKFPTAKARADAGIFEMSDATAVIAEKEVTTLLDYIMALSQ